MSINSELPVKYELTKLEEYTADQLLVLKPTSVPECKVYKRRWAVLFVFILLGVTSCSSWIQYSIIANIIMRYYNVSSYAVDWTSLIFMLIYIPIIFPAAYIVDKKGLRFSTILGTLVTAIGSWIKVVAVAPDRFMMAFVGQTIVGLSQVFLLSIPPRLAAVWFGADQVSTACALGVFGIQLGVAAGFLLPPLIIKNHENIEDIGTDLSTFCYGMAGVATIVLALTVILFDKDPPIAPSVAQALQRNAKKEAFSVSMKRLLANRGYNLMLIGYGINVGVFNAVSTMLNQLILKYFHGGEEFAGYIGLVLVLSGMAGSVICGVVLDKTHKYKETTIILYVFSFVGMVLFSYTLAYESQLIVYASATLLGFCLGGYMPVGFELVMEVTYPEPEGISAGMLLFVCQGLSFLLTWAYSWLMTDIGDKWSNSILCVLLFVGAALTAIIPPNMRRQAAVRNRTCFDLVRQ